MSCFGSEPNPSSENLLALIADEHAGWINDDVIGAGGYYIMCEQAPHRRTQVVGAYFLHHLDRYFSTQQALGQPYQPARPRPLDAVIRESFGQDDANLQYIIIPTHINGNHWTFISINLMSSSITFVDPRSPGAKPPANHLTHLLWWLQALLPDATFSVAPRTGPHPLQLNSHNCGIVVLSTVAADHLGYKAWTSEAWAEHRIDWFLRLSGMYLDEQCVCSFF